MWHQWYCWHLWRCRLRCYLRNKPLTKPMKIIDIKGGLAWNTASFLFFIFLAENFRKNVRKIDEKMHKILCHFLCHFLFLCHFFWHILKNREKFFVKIVKKWQILCHFLAFVPLLCHFLKNFWHTFLCIFGQKWAKNGLKMGFFEGFWGFLTNLCHFSKNFLYLILKKF